MSATLVAPRSVTRGTGRAPLAPRLRTSAPAARTRAARVAVRPTRTPRPVVGQAPAAHLGGRPAARAIPAARPRAAARPTPLVRPVPRRTGAVRPPLRLTRRGRLVVLLGTLVLGLAVLLVRGGQVAATGPQPALPRAVVVQPGQTLWSIAVAYAPQADPREVVDALQQLNGLSGSVVVPGQELALPVIG